MSKGQVLWVKRRKILKCFNRERNTESSETKASAVRKTTGAFAALQEIQKQNS